VLSRFIDAQALNPEPLTLARCPSASSTPLGGTRRRERMTLSRQPSQETCSSRYWPLRRHRRLVFRAWSEMTLFFAEAARFQVWGLARGFQGVLLHLTRLFFNRAWSWLMTSQWRSPMIVRSQRHNKPTPRTLLCSERHSTPTPRTLRRWATA
jgi:hypothetical protein